MRNSDNDFMRIAINLAKQGAGRVSPNPLVGALIVKDGHIIGKGFHAKFGGNHAEVNAIGNSSVIDSTMYVTLEPCNHHGKTPPCTDRIVESKIRRVVVGTVDPNPRMQGRSIQYLRGKGIEVDVGILKDEAEELIRFYAHWRRSGFPFLTIKLAITRDGYIADPDGNSKWISGLKSRTEVHKMRSEYDAVMVGTNTLLVDNPELTVRYTTGRNPNRVVIDRRGLASPELMVFANNTDRIFYFSLKGRKDLPEYVSQVTLNHKDFNMSRIMRILGENKQQSILVEGGAGMAESLIKSNLCNEIILYRGPNTFGDGIKFNEALIAEYGFKIFNQVNSGDDEKITYRRIDV